jgi:hypothetical protein
MLDAGKRSIMPRGTKPEKPGRIGVIPRERIAFRIYGEGRVAREVRGGVEEQSSAPASASPAAP